MRLKKFRFYDILNIKFKTKAVNHMNGKGILTIVTGKKTVHIPLHTILYIIMEGNNALVHIQTGQVYQLRITLAEIEPLLDENFIKVKRGCMVSVLAIHNITDKVNLVNGKTLGYASRHRTELIGKFHSRQEKLIHDFNESVALNTEEEYHEYYKLFDSLPIAFCDIEMVFDEKFQAVDWIFRYANKALGDLEKVSLDKLIGNRFGKLFPDMDVKWLRTYERAALFEETIKIVDYSPEIDTYLDIICFPTFKGHCGCILFDISKINSYRQATDTEKAMTVFFTRLMQAD